MDLNRQHFKAREFSRYIDRAVFGNGSECIINEMVLLKVDKRFKEAVFLKKENPLFLETDTIFGLDAADYYLWLKNFAKGGRCNW